jgi:hypothetical protein
MKNLYLILLCTITIGVLHSCNKSQDAVPINSGLVSNFNYKPGTYWIYRDSTTGQIDSFCVTDNSSANIGANSSEPKATIRIAITERNIYPSPVDADTIPWLIYLQYADFDLIDSKERYSQPIEFGPLFNYPYTNKLEQTGDLSGTFSVGPASIIILPNYNLNGQTFSNVMIVNETNNTTVNDIFYISTDVGIFKMSLSQAPDSMYHIWELQRYKIVK